METESSFESHTQKDVFEIYLTLIGCKPNNYTSAINRILFANKISLEALISNIDFYIYEYTYGPHKKHNANRTYSCALKRLKSCFIDDAATISYKDKSRFNLSLEDAASIKRGVEELQNEIDGYRVALDHFEPGCIEVFLNITGIISGISVFLKFVNSCLSIDFALREGKMDELHNYSRLEIIIMRHITISLLKKNEKIIQKLGFERSFLQELLNL